VEPINYERLWKENLDQICSLFHFSWKEKRGGGNHGIGFSCYGSFDLNYSYSSPDDALALGEHVLFLSSGTCSVEWGMNEFMNSPVNLRVTLKKHSGDRGGIKNESVFLLYSSFHPRWSETLGFSSVIRTEGWRIGGLFHQKWSLEVLVVMNVLSLMDVTDLHGGELAYGSLEIIKDFSW